MNSQNRNTSAALIPGPSRHAASQKADAVDPYRTLPSAQNRIKLTSEASFTPIYVQRRLSKKHVDPGLVYASRVKGRQIMLDNPPRESQRRKAMREKKNRIKAENERGKERVGMIGKREAKVKSLWKLGKDQAKFSLFLPLHWLWQGYMSELLQLPNHPRTPSTSSTYTPNSASMHAKLVKADYHGAFMTVSDAKNTALVGTCGIVVHETENAFRVVTQKDETKLLPKQNSNFTFGIPLYSTIQTDAPSASATFGVREPIPADGRIVLDSPHLLFTLYGNQFRFRAAERAGKKFKSKMSIEL